MNAMEILGWAVVAFIVMVGLPLLLVLRRGDAEPGTEPEESDWLDEHGNHIYYDRKLIRFLEQKNRKRDTCPDGRTDESGPLNESRWYDENGNHLYYDRKLIRQQEKENAGKSPVE